MVAGGAVSKVDPDSAGINPAWRKALVHAVTGQLWEDGAPVEEILAAKEKVKEYTRALEALAPDSGSYFNEVSLFHAFAAPKYYKKSHLLLLYRRRSTMLIPSKRSSDLTTTNYFLSRRNTTLMISSLLLKA